MIYLEALLCGFIVGAALGTLLFAYPLLANGGSGQQSKYNLELEFELAKGEIADYKDLESFHLDYAEESTDESENSPFHERNCSDGHCSFRAEVQMLDSQSRRLEMIGRGEKLEKFSIPFVGALNRATEWIEWVPGDQVCFRWRMKSAR